MRNVAVLSHIADIDGVGAAALIKMRYKIPASSLFFAGHSIDEMLSAEKDLARLYKRRMLLFITDLTPEPEAAPVFDRIMRGVNSHKGSVIFLDHHPWRDGMARRFALKSDLAIFGENREMCATELVRKYTGLKSAFVRRFAYIVHHTDFYIKLRERNLARLAEMYNMSIGCINMSHSYGSRMRGLRHIADIISSERFSDRRIAKLAARFKKLNEERIEKMLGGAYRISNKIAVGFSKQVDSTDACMAIISRKKVGISVLVKTDHSSGSIRSTKSNIVKLANAFGGGGHPHAAGFNIDARRYNFFRTNSDKEKFVRKLTSTAKSVGLI